ncbi:MAG: mannan-binding lectin [Oceanococcus sp.]
MNLSKHQSASYDSANQSNVRKSAGTRRSSYSWALAVIFGFVGLSFNATALTTEGVTGRNVVAVTFNGGRLEQAGSKWQEYGDHGGPRFTFQETHRDDWSVYLLDRSRGVDLQIDIHRKKVLYGENGGQKRDLYSITQAVRKSDPAPQSNKRAVNAGPIWNQGDAETKCPKLAYQQGGQWTGQWWTTVQGKMSVCEIKF